MTKPRKPVSAKKLEKMQPPAEKLRQKEILREQTEDLLARQRAEAVRTGLKIAAAEGHTEAARIERTMQCFALRKGGASYANIARNLGINEKTARELVVTELARIKEQLQEMAMEHRQLQLERLNEVILSYWPKRADPRFGAMILALMSRQDALLGIVSEKIDLNVNPSDIEKLPESEIDKLLLQRLAAFTPPKPINPPTVQ